MFWAIILALLSVYILWKVFLDEEENPLDSLPGPPRKPIIGAVLESMGKSPVGLFEIKRRHTKLYGGRYVSKLFHRRILHISNPQDVEVILSQTKNITKSWHYNFIQPWLGTGLLTGSGNKWHKRRKILTPTFHFNILKNFARVIEEKSRGLVHRLEETNEEHVSVLPLMSDFTLYTICQTAMHTKLDSDKSESAVAYKNAIADIGRLVIDRLPKLWLHSDIIYYLLPKGRLFAKALDTVNSFAHKVILERRKNRTEEDKGDVTAAFEGELGGKKRLAFLDLLLEAESKGEIDLEGIREEVNTFMVGGHDTTALALTYGLMQLADNEKIQELIYEECQSIFGDSDRTPSTSDISQMKYLEAVVKETLRLYPSVAFIGRQITEDFMLGDLLVKKGTEVGISIFDLHRREELYPDPEAFIPERFLNGGLKHNFGYIPFSAGPRNCLGQRFALLEMKYALCEICRHFKIVPKVKGARPAFALDLVLRAPDPVLVKFVRR